MTESKEREAALVTFMVTASGMSLFSVGSAFWGIVAGVLTLMILNWKTR
jgi:benzoate membrane transport protein